jgi:3-hydroxybutyryl-CoA dehydratase
VSGRCITHFPQHADKAIADLELPLCIASPTIHDDDDYARKQGLPGIIADGMISTNWIMGLFLDAFGPSILRKGRLRTKYIAPIYENQIIRSVARVTSRTEAEDGQTAVHFDVWCEDDTGKKVTVGEVLLFVPT